MAAAKLVHPSLPKYFLVRIFLSKGCPSAFLLFVKCQLLAKILEISIARRAKIKLKDAGMAVEGVSRTFAEGNQRCLAGWQVNGGGKLRNGLTFTAQKNKNGGVGHQSHFQPKPPMTSMTID
jgi:hypothetical protein